MDRSKLIATVRHVVDKLIQREYQYLEDLCGGVRLTSSEMEEGIREYGHQLNAPPDHIYDRMDFIEIPDANPQAVSTDIDLWSEGKRSDITLELTLIDSDGDLYDVEIDNLHVL